MGINKFVKMLIKLSVGMGLSVLVNAQRDKLKVICNAFASHIALRQVKNVFVLMDLYLIYSVNH